MMQLTDSMKLIKKTGPIVAISFPIRWRNKIISEGREREAPGYKRNQRGEIEAISNMGRGDRREAQSARRVFGNMQQSVVGVKGKL